MSDETAKMLRLFKEVRPLAALTTAALLVIYVDSVVIGNGVSEDVFVFYGSCQLMRER